MQERYDEIQRILKEFQEKDIIIQEKDKTIKERNIKIQKLLRRTIRDSRFKKR